MAYATYSYYTSTFLGTAIAEADFSRLANLASRHIDRMTFGRAAAIITADTPESTVTAIKNAMCAVAEVIQTNERSGNADGIVSESQGQYSVSYGANSSRARSNQSKLEDAARLWLDDTFLMFPGFNAGEYGSEIDNDT